MLLSRLSRPANQPLEGQEFVAAGAGCLESAKGREVGDTGNYLHEDLIIVVFLTQASHV